MAENIVYAHSHTVYSDPFEPVVLYCKVELCTYPVGTRYQHRVPVVSQSEQRTKPPRLREHAVAARSLHILPYSLYYLIPAVPVDPRLAILHFYSLSPAPGALPWDTPRGNSRYKNRRCFGETQRAPRDSKKQDCPPLCAPAPVQYRARSR